MCFEATLGTDMFDVLPEYGTILILREHTLHIFFLIRHVRFRTRLPIRVRPRYETVRLDVLKKVYAPFKHDAFFGFGDT